MPLLPPAHHETSKRVSPNETKIKEKQNKTILNSNSNLAKSMTHHNQTKERTTWFLTLPLSKLPLPQSTASNDNDKRKMEEEVVSSTARKHLRHINDDDGDDDSSDSPEEELPEEEVDEEVEETEEDISSEETSMNHLDTSEEELYARPAAASSSVMMATPPRCHRSHHPHQKVAGTLSRRIVTTMMTMTFRCR
jgi:hypothetical protein